MRLVALVVACCVSTAAFGPTAAAVPAKKGGGEKVICRTIEELGSRLATKRVCLTRDQWREQAEMQRQDLDRNQRSRTGPDGT